MTDTDNGKWEEMVDAAAKELFERTLVLQPTWTTWGDADDAAKAECRADAAAILQAAGVKELVEAARATRHLAWFSAQRTDSADTLRASMERIVELLDAALSDNGRA